MGNIFSCCKRGTAGEADRPRGRRNQRSFAEMEEIRENGSCGSIQRPYQTQSRQASAEQIQRRDLVETTETTPLATTKLDRQLKKRSRVEWESSLPVTRVDVDKQRNEFWETVAAFGGKPEAWNALRGAMDVWDRDLSLAQAIIDCAGLILPGGELTEVYDEFGFRYNIPDYCFNDPSNLEATEEAKEAKLRSSTRSTPSLHTRSFSEDACSGAAKSITVRMSTGSDVKIELKPSMATIEDLEQAVLKAECLKMDSGKRLMFFYSGQGPFASDYKLDDIDRLDGKTPIQAWLP